MQLLLFFVTGFLVSRVLVKTRLPQKIVYLLMGGSHNSLNITLLYLISTAAMMSFFIPNVITMLTLLPVLDLLSQSFQKDKHSKVPTMLTLAVLYGANIGGMGSITGTPSNLALLAYLKVYNIHGVNEITFFSWMLWGIPLVILLVFLAWLVLSFGFHTWRSDVQQIQMPFAPNATEHPLQSHAVGIILFYVGSSAFLSFLATAFPLQEFAILILSCVVTMSIIWYLFRYRVTIGQSILIFEDTYSNLPKNGLKLLILVLILGGVLYFLDLQTWLATQANNIIPSNINTFTLVMVAALITTFATELLSNTLVQVAMFLVLLPIMQSVGSPPAQALLVVTLSCTCAFMSPIATPVNALAFGGTPGMSITRFMSIGAIMNILCSFIITSYVLAFVPIGTAG